MDLETIGKLTLEALALQGKLEANSKSQSDASARLDAASKELSRLEGVQKQRDSAEKALKDLKLEAIDLKKQLDQRVDALEKDGVSLPFGKNEPRRGTVRLG